MNRIYKYFLSATVAVVMTFGCSMLEPLDENRLGEDRINYDPGFAEGVLMNAYSNMANQKAPNDAATDDAVDNILTGQRRMATGEWNAGFTPTSRWNHYEAVLYINKFITMIDNVTWKFDVETNELFRRRMHGEALAMRALRHFWLLQEHGGIGTSGELLGVPYIKEFLEYDADFNIPRPTFESTLDDIIADFDAALDYLPLDYDGDMSKQPPQYAEFDDDKYVYVFGPDHNHRISGRIIKAFKAKAELLAASPAFLNGGGHYETAAALAAEIINSIGGVDGMDMNGLDNWYDFSIGTRNIPEILWRNNAGTGPWFEENNFPPSLNGQGRLNPSQNLVDAFPMANGFPATLANGYDPANPYANRDPRLTTYILYNGNDLNGRVVRTGVDGGNDAVDAVPEQSTRTGYYLKKLMFQTFSKDNSGSTTPIETFDIFMRYTEVYLMLAEAANEIGGPDHQVGGISARDVIAKIRERAGLVQPDDYLASITTQKAMRQLIRNERRLELCFEGHRLYDLRRWKLLDSTVGDIKGLYFNGSAYSSINVEPRNYPDHGFYAPIPRSEVVKFDKIEQNSGW